MSSRRRRVPERPLRLVMRRCSSCSIRRRGTRCRKSPLRSCKQLLTRWEDFTDAGAGQLQPELAVPQGTPDLADEGVGHGAVAEGTRRGAGHVHVLGPRELGQGTQGDGRTLRGLGREDAYHTRACTAAVCGRYSSHFCARKRAAGPAAATADADGANGADTATGARGIPRREYGSDVKEEDGHETSHHIFRASFFGTCWGGELISDPPLKRPQVPVAFFLSFPIYLLPLLASTGRLYH
jgi:hypothetical protein